MSEPAPIFQVGDKVTFTLNTKRSSANGVSVMWSTEEGKVVGFSKSGKVRVMCRGLIYTASAQAFRPAGKVNALTEALLGAAEGVK